MRLSIVLISVALFLAIWIEPVSSIGMSSGGGACMARNAVEAYCVNHGGCPRDGNCNFPDGSYCDLMSFYNGTCPGRAYYEEALWMAEAYAFLYGDYTPYGQYYVPSVGSPYYTSPYYTNPYTSQIATSPGITPPSTTSPGTNPYLYQGKTGYYPPVYFPGYGTNYGTGYGIGYGKGYSTS